MQESKFLKSTKLTNTQWKQLYAKLKQDYPLSTIAIRDKMQRQLGFLPRASDSYTVEYSKYIYLDWYDAHKQTMFFLRYSEYIQQ